MATGLASMVDSCFSSYFLSHFSEDHRRVSSRTRVGQLLCPTPVTVQLHCARSGHKQPTRQYNCLASWFGSHCTEAGSTVQLSNQCRGANGRTSVGGPTAEPAQGATAETVVGSETPQNVLTGTPSTGARARRAGQRRHPQRMPRRTTSTSPPARPVRSRVGSVPFS